MTLKIKTRLLSGSPVTKGQKQKEKKKRIKNKRNKKNSKIHHTPTFQVILCIAENEISLEHTEKTKIENIFR